MGVGAFGRAIVVTVFCAAGGCGIAVTGAPSPVDGGSEADAHVIDGALPDSIARDVDASEDAGDDAQIDSGPPSAYAHVPLGAYDPNAASVLILASGVHKIDTSAGTIDVGAGPVVSQALNISGGVAVWSVGRLEVFGRLEVVGARPLAIVAREVIVIYGTIDGAARNAAGPGGGPPTKGPQPGTDGMQDEKERGGGGGGGHGQKGGTGADRGDAQGGAGGAATNETGALLVGGSGGGHGGGFGAGRCGGRGRGGPGGGAIQLSTMMSITIGGGAIIDVRGAGGRGGCRNGEDFSAGGGGGSGGLVYLEAAGPITVVGTVDARGGGGAEGGGENVEGTDGSEPDGPVSTGANGGDGSGNGGSGGNGGTANTNPENGRGGGNSGGGGGGAVGRLVFHTRQFAPTIGGAAAIGAKQTVDDTF